MRTYERLNAEVVKFEAQDVITASVANPPQEEEKTCSCGQYCLEEQGHGTYTWVNGVMPWEPGHWELTDGCEAPEGKHNCTLI